MTNCLEGFNLTGSTEIVISYNEIESMFDTGIVLKNSDYNKISNNILFDNTGYGISVNGTSDFNLIHHNYFI